MIAFLQLLESKLPDAVETLERNERIRTRERQDVCVYVCFGKSLKVIATTSCTVSPLLKMTTMTIV